MEEVKLSRRERERLRQRQEILEAALRLFSEKGYHNVSMHEIAHRSEFATGTLYRFFRNKEDLYESLIREEAQAFHEALLQAIGGEGDEVEKLRNYVRRKGEVFRAHIPVIRLYFSESRGERFNAGSGLGAELRKLHDEFLQALTSVLAHGIRKRRFHPIADPSLLAVALDGMTTALLLLWLEGPERHTYPEDPDVILNILFRALLQPDRSTFRSG